MHVHAQSMHVHIEMMREICSQMTSVPNFGKLRFWLQCLLTPYFYALPSNSFSCLGW